MQSPAPAITTRFDSPPFERRRAGIVLLMVAFSIMSYFDRIIMSIAGPFIMRESQVSETQMGAIYSAFILSYGLLMIPSGREDKGPLRVGVDGARDMSWVALPKRQMANNSANLHGSIRFSPIPNWHPLM